MSAAWTIISIIVTAALIGVVVEAVRVWLQDDELNEDKTND